MARTNASPALKHTQPTYTVIPPEHWSSLASGLAAGIRAGRMVETLAATISEVGGILKEHFPHHEDDSNELPDLLEE